MTSKSINHGHLSSMSLISKTHQNTKSTINVTTEEEA